MDHYRLLQKAGYDNPKYNVEKPERVFDKKKKTLVVVNTFIPEGHHSFYNTRTNIGGHHYRYSHNRIEAFKFLLACYDHFDAGMDYDLLIVDNSSPSEEFKQMLENRKTKRWIETRENTYFSFGGYKYGYDKYGKDYDYFVFHEFDWVPAKHGWLKDLVEYWVSDKEIGMIGNLIEQHGYQPEVNNETVVFINNIMQKVNPGRNFQYNLDSEYMFIDKVVVKQMEENGGWNLFKCAPETDESPVINELGFEQPILEMGYKLACFNDGEHTMLYATFNNEFPDKWWNGFDKLSPYIPEQSRIFIPKMRKYFAFYDHKSIMDLSSEIESRINRGNHD